jgi:hypothetical protein
VLISANGSSISESWVLSTAVSVASKGPEGAIDSRFQPKFPAGRSIACWNYCRGRDFSMSKVGLANRMFHDMCPGKLMAASLKSSSIGKIAVAADYVRRKRVVAKRNGIRGIL